MPYAEFGEEQYKSYLISELTDSLYFIPTQRLEKYLPYDVALNTSYFGNITGMNLQDPRHLRFVAQKYSNNIPKYFVNTFLQTKRLFYVSRNYDHNIWRHYGNPYFKFFIDDPQHTSFIGLENSIQQRAIVRYASPCFWRWEEIDIFVCSKNIVQNTHFTSPNNIGPNHECYTYINPYQKGVAFSEKKEVEPDYLLKTVEGKLFKQKKESLHENIWGILNTEMFEKYTLKLKIKARHAAEEFLKYIYFPPLHNAEPIELLTDIFLMKTICRDKLGLSWILFTNE